MNLREVRGRVPSRRYTDVLVASLVAHLLLLAFILPFILAMMGVGLWLAFEGGYVWKGKAQGNIPATLLLCVAVLGVIWICAGLMHFIHFRRVLEALASSSVRSTPRGARNCNDIRALERFAGALIPGLVKGEFATEVPQVSSGESYAATSDAGLLVVVCNRVHLVCWDMVERLTFGTDRATMELAQGPLAQQTITIPWGPELAACVPPRLQEIR